MSDHFELPILKKNRLATALALSSLVALSAAALSACHTNSKPNIVECKGVPTISGKPLYTSAGVCKKLAGGKAGPVADASVHTKVYKASDYVKCYGVAAANMNDCGTATSSCSGTVHIAKQKDAWIAIPGGICRQIKGAVAKENK